MVDNTIKKRREDYGKSVKQVVAKRVIWKQTIRQGQSVYTAKEQAEEKRFPSMLKRYDER